MSVPMADTKPVMGASMPTVKVFSSPPPPPGSSESEPEGAQPEMTRAPVAKIAAAAVRLCHEKVRDCIALPFPAWLCWSFACAQPRGECVHSPDQSLRSEDDGSDEESAQDARPAIHVGAQYLLDGDDDCRAHQRAEGGSDPAEHDHHEGEGGGLEARERRADELGLPHQQHPGDPGDESRKHDPDELVAGNVVAEAAHPALAVADAAQG